MIQIGILWPVFGVYRGEVSGPQAVALCSLRRLWAVQTIARSPLTFFRPRRRNCRQPLAYFICPNTGSMTCLRSWYRRRRQALRIVSAIACIRGLRLSTRPAVGSVSPCLIRPGER